MISYLIQTVVFSIIFMGIYHLWLKRDTFFEANRLFLLITPVLALILPFLAWEALSFETFPIARVDLPAVFLGDDNGVTAASQTAASSRVTFQTILWSVYGLGMGFNLVRFLQKILHLHRLKKMSKEQTFNGQHIWILHDSRQAFTVLNTIFIGDQISSEDKPVVIAHENVHRERNHGRELFYFELLRIAVWFNPLIYDAQHQLILVHEFIADRKTASYQTRTTYAKHLLNPTFDTRQFSCSNSFFTKHSLKTRLMMLHKNPSTPKAKLKFLILLPVVALMLTYVSCKKNKPSTETPKTAAGQSDSVTISKEEYQRFKKWSKKEQQIRRSAQRSSKDIVPFRAVEVLPRFPDAPEFKNRKEASSAFEKNIQNFVHDNFDSDNVDKEDLSGTIRINVLFTIAKDGQVKDVRARSENESLEKEAIRVIEKLPKMQPGKMKGKPIDVQYNLPIILKLK